jgi:hypothetical protein
LLHPHPLKITLNLKRRFKRFLQVVLLVFWSSCVRGEARPEVWRGLEL